MRRIALLTLLSFVIPFAVAVASPAVQTHTVVYRRSPRRRVIVRRRPFGHSAAIVGGSAARPFTAGERYRSLSDTFAGIRPADAPGFIVAQLAGGAAATAVFRWLIPAPARVADRLEELS